MMRRAGQSAPVVSSNFLPRTLESRIRHRVIPGHSQPQTANCFANRIVHLYHRCRQAISEMDQRMQFAGLWTQTLLLQYIELPHLIIAIGPASATEFELQTRQSDQWRKIKNVILKSGYPVGFWPKILVRMIHESAFMYLIQC